MCVGVMFRNVNKVFTHSGITKVRFSALNVKNHVILNDFRTIHHLSIGTIVNDINNQSQNTAVVTNQKFSNYSLRTSIIQKKLFGTSFDKYLINLLSSPHLINEQRRHKSKKNQKRPEYDSDSDSEEEEEVQGTNVLTVNTQSTRLDGFLKKALGVARNKVETAFYEGNIRVNGTKPSKKSYQLKIGDEVDLIRGVSPMNPDFLSVSRVELLSVKENTEEEDQLIVKVRRTKTMYIENYPEAPWKKGTSAQ